jgi:hypothetical protein
MANGEGRRANAECRMLNGEWRMPIFEWGEGGFAHETHEIFYHTGTTARSPNAGFM